MQKQSPVILESFEECMETSASKAPLKHLVPLMALFMLQLGLAVSSVVRLFVRHYVPTLRKSDSWGLLPFAVRLGIASPARIQMDAFAMVAKSAVRYSFTRGYGYGKDQSERR